jgi:hypothetical protein
VIEVFAAIIGASIGVIGISAAGFNKRNSESREAIIKLTAGVEAIANKLEDLHQDMKAEKVQASMDRREIYERLNEHGNRLVALENGKARI